MKKFTPYLLLILLLTMSLSSCKNAYSTYSSSKDNISQILILKKQRELGNITLTVDGKKISVDVVYTEKKALKARPIEVSPGKHHVVITENGNIIFDSQILLGLHETRKIVLK